jgi:tetratricopeptide (TPR) repeat protein
MARLIDKLLTLTAEPAEFEAFRWQLEAVRRHVGDLPTNAPETAHLAGVVAAIPSSGPAGPNLWKGLTAYAYFLEHEARLEESLEMLTLAARAQGSEISATDFTAYALFAGRLNRQLARWDSATQCYSVAEDTAARVGESVSLLRSRLGRGAVLRGQGNYPAARGIAEGVLHEATALGLSSVQVMAYSDLGVLYSLQGSRIEGLQAHYRAFQLTVDPVEQMRSPDCVRDCGQVPGQSSGPAQCPARAHESGVVRGESRRVRTLARRGPRVSGMHVTKHEGGLLLQARHRSGEVRTGQTGSPIPDERLRAGGAAQTQRLVFQG